ncbi:hypothetical protein IE53DRAFT_261704 [Violaceomyces palustris]|uniref:Uncharacterized protein n=1 Tax=Violaceomyces palustris TaxID=1673888 RepID=A0ACD0NN65_9BASI|nr:hypothetical protein IE53DRAFT_261704 [Violaceomyces palustris]
MAPSATSCDSAVTSCYSSGTKTCCEQPRKSSRQSSRVDHGDRFYGHKDMAELCEKVILALFACPLDSTSASVNSPTSPSRPAPRLSEFIAYALYRTRLPVAVTHQALFLLKRLKCRFPAARGSSGHRLFISALMLASKSSCDDTYSNKSWTIVGQGLFSLREINQMERELFGYLGYKVNVEVEELDHFVKGLEEGRIQTSPESSPPASVTSPALAGPEEGFSSPVIATSIPHSKSEPISYPSDASSPPSESLAGPHRVTTSVRHARHSSSTPSINTRASISGYSVSTQAGPSSVGTSCSVPNLSRSTSFKHDRHLSGHSVAFDNPFVSHPRDRCRPYTMPTHSMPLTSASSQAPSERFYSSASPTSSVSSSSLSSSRSSLASSFTASTSSSPCLSRSTFSGRTTPDTPTSDIDSSPWEEKAYLPLEGDMDTSPSAVPVHGYDNDMKYYVAEQHPTHLSKLQEQQRQAGQLNAAQRVRPYW